MKWHLGRINARDFFRARSESIIPHYDGCKHEDTGVSHLDGAHESKAACVNAPVHWRSLVILLASLLIPKIHGARATQCRQRAPLLFPPTKNVALSMIQATTLSGDQTKRQLFASVVSTLLVQIEQTATPRHFLILLSPCTHQLCDGLIRPDRESHLAAKRLRLGCSGPASPLT